MYDRYEEKEHMLDHYYKYDKLPSMAVPQRCLPLRTDGIMQVDLLHISLYHLFFIVSTYLHIVYIYKPLLNLLFGGVQEELEIAVWSELYFLPEFNNRFLAFVVLYAWIV